MSIPSCYSDAEPLLNVASFKKRFLHGVNTTDRNGNELDDEVIGQFLRVAVDYLSFELNVPIFPKDMDYFEDYDFASYRQYMFLQVPIYPIVKDSVVQVSLEFAPTVKVDFPKEWYKIYERAGQIQLLPTVSTLSAVLIQASGMLLPRAISSERAPQLLHIRYKAGLVDENDCVPPLINQVIGLIAAVYLLQMIGDIGPLGEPGISGYNLSMDNLSQNINTPISATSNIYGATITKYQTLLDKTLLPLLKRRYKRIRVEFI